VKKPLLEPEQAARLLDGVIYERVRSAIDLSAIHLTELVLAGDLEAIGFSAEQAAVHAKLYVDAALERVLREPRDSAPILDCPCDDPLCSAFGEL
jgi:hypothetical protein